VDLLGKKALFGQSNISLIVREGLALSSAEETSLKLSTQNKFETNAKKKKVFNLPIIISNSKDSLFQWQKPQS
jgi:hypothetical protein